MANVFASWDNQIGNIDGLWARFEVGINMVLGLVELSNGPWPIVISERFVNFS